MKLDSHASRLLALTLGVCLAGTVLPMTGCNDSDTGEEAGEAVDEAIDNAGDAIDDAADSVDDAIDDVVDG